MPPPAQIEEGNDARLPYVLQAELDLPARPDPADLAEARIRQRVTHTRKVHLVESIKEFAAELEPLLAPGHDLFQQGEIAGPEARIRQDIAPGGSINAGRRRRKSGGIKKLRDHVGARCVIPMPVGYCVGMQLSAATDIPAQDGV